MTTAAAKLETLVLDGTKIGWHLDRVAAWERGERIAPVTIDMALNQRCQMRCGFCYMQTQQQERHERITFEETMVPFLHDCAELGVRGMSFVSDGESTLSKAWEPSILLGKRLGISMAAGTNGLALDRRKLEATLPCLDYMRFNVSAGEKARYAEIMGCKPEWFDAVMQNIETAVAVKAGQGLSCTLGIQMVLRPQDADQIVPFARLAVSLGVDYGVVKHCSDDEHGSLNVDYDAYAQVYDKLFDAEALSNEKTKIIVKWSKIKQGNARPYQRCHGPPFILQISGSGLVAPCGMLFADQHSDFHVGNIVTERFKDIIWGDRYWAVMDRLRGPTFDARTMCGSLCLQHKTNEALDLHVKGQSRIAEPQGLEPAHVNFI